MLRKNLRSLRHTSSLPRCGVLLVRLARSNFAVLDLGAFYLPSSFEARKPISISLTGFATANRITTTLNGGGERDRTDDLLRARQALSQLSYTPIS